MPTIRPWEVYYQWFGTYASDVVYVHLPMQPVVILGSAQAAFDLLDNKSQMYSDRPTFVMVQLLPFDFNFGLMQYGMRWRTRRRLFHQYFNKTVVHKYHPIQLQEARASLSWFLDSPKDSRKAARRFVTAIIFNVVYGMKVSSLDDEYVIIAQRAAEAGSLAAVPGAFWVEFLPWLKYIPGWVPGNSAKKFAAMYEPIVQTTRRKPYELVKNATLAGRAPPSVAHSMVRKIQDRHGGTQTADEHTEVATDVAALAYAGGADTTTSSCESFLLAMALFPEVQKKAQEELDRVVGPNHLPDYNDYDSLTYIRAIMMEITRWQPPFPIVVPHQSMTDDVYRGYFILKGSIVIPCVWTMLHNPEDHPEPEIFNPDRFIGTDGQIDPAVRDPSTLTFGFGRRSCPGRHFSQNSIFIFVASMLHVFNISAGVDDAGKPIVLSTELINGILTAPCDVPCDIKPRSKEAERLIRDAALDSE